MHDARQPVGGPTLNSMSSVPMKSAMIRAPAAENVLWPDV
jgi:hypothetical protein